MLCDIVAAGFLAFMGLESVLFDVVVISSRTWCLKRLLAPFLGLPVSLLGVVAAESHKAYIAFKSKIGMGDISLSNCSLNHVAWIYVKGYLI
jgi:hypothetical protein